MNKVSRKIFIGGNWKSNNTLAQTQALMTNTINPLKYNTEKIEVLIAPTYLHIPEINKSLQNPNVLISAQNINNKGFGAYTGETSLNHLKDYNVNWTLLGHSERRAIYNESSSLVGEKTKFALENKMNVVLCVGESLEQRESNKTMDVVIGQLKACSDVVEKDMWSHVVIAYEPVWAIGTGKVASPQQAQDVHQGIRTWVRNVLGSDSASGMRIIYGGSVKGSNCEELIKMEDIDGFLIGGAALKPDFGDIVSKCDNL